ncbi:MAG: 50S ribosomal protein L23 [Desulfovibrionaceae bacterium]|nr:50S ribosomal protein L23 [Desulfovibrionaceae bacterium]
MNKSYVLVRPFISEKSTALHDAYNRFTFEVHPNANKAEIKEAIEETFDVTVKSVNVVRMRSVNRTRQGRTVGRTKCFKKAYVTLAEGDKIEFFEGV